MFQFLTDEGLIPNYAFPQQGVTLRSIIFRAPPGEQRGEAAEDRPIYEYERPAEAALGELAPENEFRTWFDHEKLSGKIKSKIAAQTQHGVKEVDDAYRDATALLTGESANPATLGYAAAIVDEAQDMGAPEFRLLRIVAPPGRNDLFIASDGHQRIYGRRRVALGRCGIDIHGRSRKLKLNYRTTEQTRRWATALLAGRDINDLDDTT